jgi:hypothetical protein
VAHALTQPLHAEFLCLKDFPLQCKDEIFLEKRKILGASKKGNVFLRKIEEGKALRIHRASLGYRPSGLSSTDMRARLILLLPKIEERIKLGEAAGTEDDGSHEICLDYASRIKTMLAANPTNVVAVPVPVSVPVANVASPNSTTPSPGDTPPRAVRVITVVSKAKQAQAQAQAQAQH